MNPLQENQDDLSTFGRKIKTRPDFTIESQVSGQDAGNVVGVDEVGCGPWAGPVIAGACVFMQPAEPLSVLKFINDSKLLSKKKREFVFEELTNLPEHLFRYSIGIANVEEIDALNIGQATCLAMQRAVHSLPIKVKVALIDGIRKPDLEQKVITVIRGDQKSYSIAAASIIAKVTRDRLMTELGQEFPQYGWGQNAGYGTRMHQSALKEFGVTIHHRCSFKPISKLLGVIN